MIRYSYDVKKEITTQLRRYNAFKTKLRNIEERLEELESEDIRAIQYDTIPGQSSVSKESSLNSMIELKSKLKTERCELKYTISNLDSALDELKLNKKLYQIIEMRYFNHFSVAKICMNLYIDKSTYYRYENKAFEIIKAYMPI